MGSINWIGIFALQVLSHSLLGGTALAQENTAATERRSSDARARNPHPDEVRDTISGRGQVHRNAKSGVLEWGTGGFELRGERLKSGSKLISAVRGGSQWRRTYAADMRFWANAAPGIVFEAGARFEHTNSGVQRGPLLTDSTQSAAKMAYVGAQMSGSSSIRLLGFDNGGWTGGTTWELVSRIANGEPAARQGAAIEIGNFAFRPGDAGREPQFKLRFERGRTAGSSDTSATISWENRF